LAKRSVGTKLMIGLNAVAGLTSIGGIAKTADTLDTTTLDSDGGYRTFTGGFKDGGEVSLSGFFEPGDTGQMAMDAAFEAGEALAFQIIFPVSLGASWSFQGVVTAFSTGAELEELVSFEATVKVSGKPTLVTTPSAGLSALAVTGTGGALTPAFAANKTSYTFSGVTGASVTVTATGAGQTIKLYADGTYLQDLVSGAASNAITLVLNTGKRLTIVANETGKAPVLYDIIAVKVS